MVELVVGQNKCAAIEIDGSRNCEVEACDAMLHSRREDHNEIRASGGKVVRVLRKSTVLCERGHEQRIEGKKVSVVVRKD